MYRSSRIFLLVKIYIWKYQSTITLVTRLIAILINSNDVIKKSEGEKINVWKTTNAQAIKKRVRQPIKKIGVTTRNG